jgi:zinc/manganese transport system ATP-binding protein
MSIAVRLENLTLSYQRHPAVHHISGTFAAGSLTAVTGPNGGGKSTLLRAIAGLMTPDSGHIHYDGAAKPFMAYLAQSSQLSRDMPMTVLHLAAMGLWSKLGNHHAIDAAQQDKILAALEATGLRGFENRDVSTLSAGQFQRALFARLMLQDAQLLLLDEPFAAVDDETLKRLLAITQQWHKEGRTIICVLHDNTQIQQFFPQCLLLARDPIAWGNTADVLRPESFNHTRMFQEAWNPAAEVCAV